MFVGEFHENVLEARRKWPNLRHGNAVVAELIVQAFQIKALVDERVYGLPENRGAANSGKMTGQS